MYKDLLTQAELEALLAMKDGTESKPVGYAGEQTGDKMGQAELQRILQELRETREAVQSLTARVQMLEQLVVQKGLLPRIELELNRQSEQDQNNVAQLQSSGASLLLGGAPAEEEKPVQITQSRVERHKTPKKSIVKRIFS